MFPIIPYNYNISRSAICFDNNLISKDKMSVFATCDIPENTISEPINPSLLCKKMDKNDSNVSKFIPEL